jgi:hypothetical protein
MLSEVLDVLGYFAAIQYEIKNARRGSYAWDHVNGSGKIPSDQATGKDLIDLIEQAIEDMKQALENLP